MPVCGHVTASLRHCERCAIDIPCRLGFIPLRTVQTDMTFLKCEPYVRSMGELDKTLKVRPGCSSGVDVDGFKSR